MHGDPPTDFTDSKTVMERWHDWTYEKDGIPMLKFTGIDYYPHGSNPEMSYRIWTEFFFQTVPLCRRHSALGRLIGYLLLHL